MRALLLVLALAGCAVAPSATRHERPADAQALRIVSLNPCTDAILAEVADPAQLLAISHYSQDARSTSMDLAIARRFHATGGTAEEVMALAPDVVVGSDFMNPATRAAFERLGMRVETVGMTGTVADSVAQVRQLAALVGHPDRGEALVAEIEAAARPADGALQVETALWQGGGIVPGKGTLISDLMTRAGMASYSAARGMGQGDYLSLERIAADPPQLLLVAGSEAGQSHPVLSRIAGMRVARFEPSLIYCGGPSIARAMDRLRAVLRDGRPFDKLTTSGPDNTPVRAEESLGPKAANSSRSIRAEEGSSDARSAVVENPSRSMQGAT